MGGFALRLQAVGKFNFTADEALYSAWALHGFRVDPLFLAVWPDKPPLFIWLLGSAFAVMGNRPEAAQFLNVCLSTLTIPVVLALGSRLWARGPAVAAALLMALSPFAISFSPTAFTDPLLVLAGTLALVCAIRGARFWSGIWLGVALMTKQTGLLYVPLVAAVLWLEHDRAVPIVAKLSDTIAGLLLVVAPIVLWDSVRWSVAPSPWDLSIRNYGVMTLAQPGEWSGRLAAWWGQIFFLVADWTVWTGMTCVGLTVCTWRRHSPGRRAALLLCGWTIAYVAIHVVTTVQIWDRYLLPLVPMVSLLTGWAALSIFDSSRHEQSSDSTASADAVRQPWWAWVRYPAGAALVLLLAGPAITAANGGLPVGGDKGAYAGLPHATAWLLDHMAEPFVLYHSDLGWHLQYYLFDARAGGRVDLRWYPSTTYLADNAEKTPHLRKFILEPRWTTRSDLGPRLAMRGLDPVEHARFGQFTLIEIVSATPPAQRRMCTWCFSRASHGTAAFRSSIGPWDGNGE